MATQRVAKGDSESSIDQVNQWMRSQPWYQAQLAQWGVNPNSVKLTEAQRNQLVALAQANGVQVDQGNIEVDPAGNFNPIGHKLRNGLLAAGIGGAAVAAPFALGALAGSGGAASVPALASGVPSAIGGASALPTLGTLSGLGTGAGFIGADVANTAASALGGEALGAGPALTSIPRLASGVNPALQSMAGGGSSLGGMLSKAIPYLSQGVGSVLANRSLNNSNDQANQYLQQATQQGLGINKNVYDQSLGAAQNAYTAVSSGYQPYQQVGQQGLATLASLAGVTRPDLARRADFALPTLEQAKAMPGYQFGLDQGIRGVNAGAAARGGLLTGGAVKAADKFATDYASTKYNDLVQQALAAYNANTSNDLNVYNANTANFDRPFNQAATLASLGQYGTTGAATAANNLANQTINAGGQYGQNATNMLTSGANANAANAQAGGRNNASTTMTLANLIQDYFANKGY